MESGILDLLINGSPMAAFAGFLIYLYRTQQARMDTLVDKFQTQLEAIRKEYKDDVTELRGRYDSVISGQNAARDRIKDGIEDRLKEVHTSLSTIQSGVSKLSISQEIEKDEITTMARNVEVGLEIIKSMQEEAKLKEIAKHALKNP